MTPKDIATDVSAIQSGSATQSLTASGSYVGGNYVVDDWH